MTNRQESSDESADPKQSVESLDNAAEDGMASKALYLRVHLFAAIWNAMVGWRLRSDFGGACACCCAPPLLEAPSTSPALLRPSSRSMAIEIERERAAFCQFPRSLKWTAGDE